MISMGGDWFYYRYPSWTLALELTKSHGDPASYSSAIRSPTFLVTPLSGVLADRFNRKSIIIITCNLISAVTVLWDC